MVSSPAEAAIVRARSLLGTRFVPQGRDPVHGLDCVGLIAAAWRLPSTRRAYAWRGGTMALVRAGLDAAGLREVAACAPGDVLVTRAGPGQLHLVLWTGGSIIHADAGLRRIVERPAPIPWPVLGSWRPSAPDEEATWRP